MAEVAIQNLFKKYAQRDRDSVALDDVNLKVASGEFMVLVGPSGCGKSTLLRSIAGLETPSAGTIEIGGKRVDSLPPSERGIGMVFQDYALYPHMSVRENLSFGLRIRGLPKSEVAARIQETTVMLELEDLLERKPSQLSGGQRQRVAIGRALVKRPSVLLLDEPLSNLDAQLRAQTRLEIAALHRRIGSTTLYVTHDQDEAMTLGDRIAILRSGKLQQVATPMELYRNPTNRFVASFIGSPMMNFLHGRFKNGVLETEGQEIAIPKDSQPTRDGEVVLGFRPEAFRFSEKGIPVKLEWLENHGFENHVIGRIGSTRVTLRAVQRDLKIPELFRIEIDFERIHWF